MNRDTPNGKHGEPDDREVYEVFISGHFDEVFPADSEADAVAQLRASLPPEFTVDEEAVWVLKKKP